MWGCLISTVRILEGNMKKWGTSWRYIAIAVRGGDAVRGGTVVIGPSI